ncbi:MAG: preprotein translocase subunit SecG [Alistipes sp.]|nr:preprotein translocase subunit SecG [Alistipes sp.]
MYTFCIIMIAIASVLLILAVLVQAPKSGMAANFGAANQTMGVRQTSDFLEKFTWAMVAAIVLFTLLSVTAMPSEKNAEKAFNPVVESKEVVAEPAALEIPAEGAEATTEAPAAEATTEAPAAEVETPAAE